MILLFIISDSQKGHRLLNGSFKINKIQEDYKLSHFGSQVAKIKDKDLQLPKQIFLNV